MNGTRNGADRKSDLDGECRFTRRQLEIAKMILGNPRLRQNEIAESLGVSTRTVERVSAKLRQFLGDENQELEEYKAHLRKEVPIERRAKTLASIISPARARKNPFAAVRAIEYADRITGVNPDYRERDAEPRESQPLIVFPPGTEIRVGIKVDSKADQPEQAKRIAAQGSEDEAVSTAQDLGTTGTPRGGGRGPR